MTLVLASAVIILKYRYRSGRSGDGGGKHGNPAVDSGGRVRRMIRDADGAAHQSIQERILATSTTNDTPMIYARIAGVLYLIIIVSGIFGEAFVRSSLVVPGDASATSGNILASQSLFRLGFVADSVMLLADVALAVVLYMLLEPVSKILSLAAASFRLMQAAILGLNLLNYYAALLLLSRPGYLTAWGGDDLNALSMFFLDMHSHGYDLGLIFFGVSNIVLGYLIVKSDRFPGVLGYGLMGAALVYLSGSYVRFVFPTYASVVEPFYLIPLIAELSFCLWLLVKGIRIQG